MFYVLCVVSNNVMIIYFSDTSPVNTTILNTSPPTTVVTSKYSKIKEEVTPL